MSKKSNNKGYFLAETIVVIALVTSVMAYVFPNVTKVYDNYNNRSKYYDQTEDVYLLKAIAEYYENLTGDIVADIVDESGTVRRQVTFSDQNYIGYLTYNSKAQEGDPKKYVITNDNLSTYPDNTGAGCKSGNDFDTLTTTDEVEVHKVSTILNDRNSFGAVSFSITPITFTNNTNYKTSDGYILKKLYITGYLNSPTTSKDYNFNKYLNRLKKNTSDSSSYRLIGIFSKSNSERYASIKVDNPNPKRNCNLGG